MFILLFAAHIGNSQVGGGDILYRNISNLEVEVTINIYVEDTIGCSQILIHWGDNTADYISVISVSSLPGDYFKCNFVSDHVFPGPGTYDVTSEISLWLNNIKNIPNSGQESFSLKSTITINPFFQEDNFPILINPPIEIASVGSLFLINPAAYDTDGDSISYRLVNCIGNNTMEIPGYQLPEASVMFTIDPINGDITWDSPVDTGTYAIAIMIEEWRQGVIIGNSFRQMTIVVESTTWIDEEQIDEITVFPNPTSELIYIKTRYKDDKVTIYNVMGNKIQIIYETPDKISLNGVPEGIYFLQVKRGDKVQVFKVVKK